MSETWTVKKILDWTHLYFKDKNVSEPRLGAELLLADVLDCKRIELYVQFERILSNEERAAYREIVKRRSQHEPVQYILGETEFMGLPFQVNPAVLIPRPETEILVDSVLDFQKEEKMTAPQILDVGTGSGCIAISLAHLLPDAALTALEKSGAALEMAGKNASLNKVDVRLVEGDVFEWAASASEQFDILVSNPPYIAAKEWDTVMPDVREFEPREALLAGDDGLAFYRRLIPIAGRLLKEKAVVFLETGYDQARVVAEMFRDAGYLTRIRADLNGIERVLIATRGIAAPEQQELVVEAIIEKPIDLDEVETGLDPSVPDE